MKTPRWKTALRCLPLVLLAVVLWREKPWTIHLAARAPWAVAASIALNLIVFLPLKAARWRVALTQPPPFRQVLAATLEGLLANAAIGFGSGDLVRAARLRGHQEQLTASPELGSAERSHRGRVWEPSEGSQMTIDYACAWAERGAEVLALALLIFVTALIAHLGVLAVALSGAAVAAYLALLGAGRLLVPRLGRWPRVERAVAAGLQASTPRRVAVMAALSLAGWASELMMLLLFQIAFHLTPDVRMALLTLVGINAAIVIPALPGNFGTFEAGATMALVMCGAPRDVAVAYALTYHLSHVLPVALIATGVYLVRNRRYKTTPARTSTGP